MATARSWSRRKVHVRPQGEIRRSQVISTYGPGAMIDLVDHAVLVGGLDFWSYDRGKGSDVIVEHRLRDSIAERFQKAGRELAFENAFREPPVGNDREPSRFSGVQVLEFPQWFVCQNPTCRALNRSDQLERKRERYVHDCDRNRRAECVPVRFVVACPRGHLEEFPWVYFAHRRRGKDGQRCAAPSLRLHEGASGDFSEIVVQCACGAKGRLSGFEAKGAAPLCRGERPWLGREGKEDCDQHVRLMVRTASNAYFAQVMSALSVPEVGRELEEAVRSHWRVLKTATVETLPAFRTIEEVGAALSGYDDKQVLAAVEKIREGLPVSTEPIRTVEFKQFTAAPPEVPGVLPPAGEPFFARRCSPEGGLPAGVERVVLAHKLREVRTQIGFTRIEPVSPDLQGEFDLEVESAMLGLTTNWLPATEVLGEGVFLQFEEAAIAGWEQRPSVRERARQLAEGHDAWTRHMRKPPPFPGVRFYFLHSLAHLLISAISLECGYAASAIRERIYCAAGGKSPMAAILLSTGTSGTEGTLGGLVEQGRRIREHLRHAFDMGRLCSNDPVCANHSPEGDQAERFLEGAACHGCLYVAECSCERFNRYLDRALVVPTIGHPPDLAFFGERP